MNEVVHRCRAICGENRASCFAANANHLECITDIIVNKIWAARAVIELGTRENTCEDMIAILNVATSEMDELVHWVKNMQTMQHTTVNKGNEEGICRR